MKKIILISAILLLSIQSLFAVRNIENSSVQNNDTANFTEIYGKIIDSETDKPIVFASIAIFGTSIATVSNSDGEFVLKISKDKEADSLSITHLGYENVSVSVSAFLGAKKQVKLKVVPLPINEVVVSPIDPQKLIESAINKIKTNYSETPEMQTAFYRETIKQNHKYVSVSEAVLDIYKSAYKTSFDNDRIKIYKGRKSHDVKKMDTLIIKLQGGVRTSLFLDVVKTPGDILHPEILEYYEYKLLGVTTIDNNEVYIIFFDQLKGLEYPLYSGYIYIDVVSQAFAGLDFKLSERGLPYAPDAFVKKKPNNLKIEIEEAAYVVRYRKDDGKWYLSYVRSELALNSRWKRKLFKSKFVIMLEMAITNRDKENIDKFPNRESVKITDIFTEKVSSFEDEDFWGDYNIIKPDDSIELAIEKLNKKIKRIK